MAKVTSPDPAFRFCTHGAAATGALAEAIGDAKGGDPMAPVTVIVPSNLVGVAARRTLAARDGLAAVRFDTLLAVARSLAPLAGDDDRRTVSDPVVAAAVRTALADSADLLAPVATHPATERAVMRVHRELRELDDHELDALAATSARSAEVVALHRQVAERIARQFIDEVDQHRLAAQALDAGHGGPLGAVVLHCPDRLPRSAVDLLEALAAHRPFRAVMALTGDTDADAPVTALAARLGAPPDTSAAPLDPPPHRTFVRSLPDPDEEARWAVRAVVDAAAAGTPFARMAIVHPPGGARTRLVHQHLAAADVPFTGASARRLDESLTGRTLLRLLDLPEQRWSRTAVMAVVADGAVLDRGSPAPGTAWERIARRAGVVSGSDQWRPLLERFADDADRQAGDLAHADPDDPRIHTVRRDTALARDLADFVDRLRGDLDATPPRTWPDAVRWLLDLLTAWVGPTGERGDRPPAEADADQRIDDMLRGLERLDAVEPQPSPAAIRRAVAAGLDRRDERHGRFGDGVHVGTPTVTAGLDLDLVIVIGLAEGITPARRRDDPLLPDRARRAVGGGLSTLADLRADEHRGLLATLAGAPERILSFPRGDLGARSEHVASRWLLDEIAALHGRRPSPPELEKLDEPWFTTSPSYLRALETTAMPASLHEHRLASLLRGVEPDLGDDRPVFAAGIAAITERRDPRLGSFDGVIDGADLPALDDGRLLSATRLEAWVRCPHAYFVEYVLGVAAVDEPVDEDGITAIDRGNLAHAILEQFIGVALADPPAPAQAWSAAHRGRLHAICDEAFADIEARGRTGRPLLWRRDAQHLRRDLDRFLADDAAWRHANRATPIAVEAAFGRHGRPAFAHRLPDGRVLRFSGQIDRVDRSDTGDLLVSDYKTGSRKPYTGISSTDPDKKGAHLQLPLYALAAAELHGGSATGVTAGYWFTGDSKARVDLVLDDGVRARIDHVLGVIADAIASGLFPARPPKNDRYGLPCRVCNPDGHGTATVARRWELKRVDPRLDAYRMLIGDLTPDAVAGTIDLGGSDG